jgi:hypothetical protein
VVDEGNTTLVESSPRLGIDVSADTELDVVSVRVDGTTRRQFTPNATTLSESFRLELASGEHTVTVVAKADEVTTHEVTVTKDAARPYVRYTAPFETEQYAPPPENARVNDTNVTLAGEFTDVTGVERVRIVRETRYRVGTRTRTDRAVYRVDDPGETFSQPLFLGIGTNNITARYYDEVGNRREHRLTITVDDTAPPSLAGLSAARTGSDRLRIRGTATDNGQLSSVTVRAQNRTSRTYLYGPTDGRPDPTARRHAFDTNATLRPGTTAVVINATDTAGNSVQRTVAVRRTVVPDLRLAPGRTRMVNRSVVVAAGTATDGEIVAASVETVDPDTGDVVDLVSLHDGRVVNDLGFEERLAAPEGRTVTVRLRVTDSAGTEHVVSLNRTLTVEDESTATATPTPTPTATATATATPTPTPATTTAAPPANATAAGITVPFVGVTVPVPDALGASVSVPVPVVGPFAVPLVPVAALALAVGGVVARRR